jgi:hypothetical protein
MARRRRADKIKAATALELSEKLGHSGNGHAPQARRLHPAGDPIQMASVLVGIDDGRASSKVERRSDVGAANKSTA